MELAKNNLIKALAEQTSEALIGLDLTFRIFLFNKNAEKIFKCEASSVVGNTFNEFCKKIKIPYFLDEYKNNLDSSVLSCEIPTLINKLKLNWQMQKVGAKKDTFYIIRTVGLEEKTNKNEIFQLQTLIENMPCNVYWVDNHCKMIGCNQNVLTMLGMTLQDFKGKTYEELSDLCNWPEGLAQKLKNDDLSVMRSGKPVFGIEDPPLPHADGSFSNFLTSRVPLRNNDGEIIGIAGISTEVSALKEAKYKAEAANIAKSEFLRNMEHQLRTPFSGVYSMVEFLASGETDPKKKEFLEVTYQSAKEFLELLNDIINFSRNQNDGTIVLDKKFDLQELIKKAITMEKAAATAKHLKLIQKYPANIPLIWISDPKRIQRIILNLLSNAIKFSSEGTITVKVKLAKNIDEKHGVIQIFVTDMGIGIPEDKQEFIYEKFYRVSPANHNQYTGAGLGLHIVKELINDLDGEIEVISTVNKGTTFICTLPLKRPLIDEILCDDDLIRD